MSTFTDLEAIRREMDLMLARVEQQDFAETLQITLSQFEYQGLNVLGITNEIYRRGVAAGKARSEIREDIVKMIVLFLSRGNNIDKMMTRTNDAGRILIQSFKQVYSLSNNVGRGGNTVITLSRVATVFPVITVRILASPTIRIPRAVTLSTSDFGSNFPSQMQTVIVAAILPKSDLGRELMKALLLYLIEENKLLSQAGSMSDADILKRVLPFARASFVSSIVPESAREDAVTSAGLLIRVNQTLSIPATVATAISTFDRKYPLFNISSI